MGTGMFKKGYAVRGEKVAITPDISDKIIELRSGGYGYGKIAAKLGIGKNTVIRHIKAHEARVEERKKNAVKKVDDADFRAKEAARSKGLGHARIDLAQPLDGRTHTDLLKDDIAIALRIALYELTSRFPSMDDREVYNAMLELLKEVNKK